jgi:hypothetical protein
MKLNSAVLRSAQPVRLIVETTEPFSVKKTVPVERQHSFP